LVGGRLVDGWLARFATLTATAYRRDLAQFAAHAGDPLTATRADVQSWIQALTRRGLKPASIRRKASAVSSFLDYAATEGAVPNNAARHTRRPLGGDGIRLGLDRDQARRLIAEARARGPRAATLIGLLTAVGLRVTEACSARIENLTTDAGVPVIELTRKGGRTARVPIPAPVMADLLAATTDRTEGPILECPRGGHITRHHAAKIVSELGDAAGIPDLTPHLLRHTAATTALRAGVPLEHVQQLLGHRSPTTTLRYAQALKALDRTATTTLAAELYD